MAHTPPRLDPSEWEEELTEEFEEGSAGRTPIDPAEADPAARSYWDAAADQYQAEHGQFLGEGGVGFVWGPEGLTEAAAQLLGPIGDLAGRRVLEVGCGAAQCSRWLAAHAALAIGIDISVRQLQHAHGAPVAAASATALPFGDGLFAAAFASYGAVQFVADLDRLLAEVHRVLVPGGRWVFAVTHPIRWALPDSPDADGLTVGCSYFDRTPYVERDGSGRATYAEFHRTIADYFGALLRGGFAVESVVEPEWPVGHERVWGGWSPLRGRLVPGTLVVAARAT
ncbi:MAG: class I SAM-dependent methyltransferase [Candidatus Nanopelagicales bacterium]